MLTPELKKLKQYLEGSKITLDNERLLEELGILEDSDLVALYESLSKASNCCKTCGRPL